MINKNTIKKDFPIFKANPKLVYLDSAATTQKPQAVIDALVKHYENTNANIHRGIYEMSEQATKHYEEARAKIARFIGAQGARNIIFTRNTTEAVNLVAQSFARHHLKAGDEILLTVMEHHSNIVPWYLVAKEKKLKLRFVRITSDGTLDPKDLVAKATKKVKLAAFTHVSNVLGTVNPARDLVSFFHARGIPALIDGAQAVPHMSVDVSAMDCDFYAFSGHKMLAPTCIGVLYMKDKYLGSLPPFLGGGEMIRSVSETNVVFADAPAKFEAGTPAIEAAIALGAAVDYLEHIGMKNIERHEKELAQYTLEKLRQVPGVTVYGPTDMKRRSGAVAFNLKGIHPHDIASLLDEQNIAVRAGNHCAMPLHKFLGVPATCRISPYIYNTKKDIGVLYDALGDINKTMFGS